MMSEACVPGWAVGGDDGDGCHAWGGVGGADDGDAGGDEGGPGGWGVVGKEPRRVRRWGGS